MIALRSARPDERAALSALCLHSKAHWGYEAAFLEACRAELTLSAEEVCAPGLSVAERAGAVAGLVQVSVAGEEAELLKLFVAPERMGEGVGRALYDWARGFATAGGAVRMRIEADPGAVPFYDRLGARRVGFAPSGSIAGRRLPVFLAALS